jgi:hypothetical protein
MDIFLQNNSGGTRPQASLVLLSLARNVSIFHSVETLPGYEARAAFTVNSAAVFREDVDIVPTIVDDTHTCVPWGGDNQPLARNRTGANAL